MKYSTKLLLYYFFLKEFAAYVAAHFAELGVSEDQSNELNDLWTDYLAKTEAYTSPITYGPASNSNINGAYNICFPFTEGIRGQIKSNPSIALDGTDRLALDIPVEKPKRGHIPIPSISPNISLINKKELMIEFFAFNPELPAKKAKPKDVTQIGIKMVITDVDAPEPRPASYVMQLPETKTIFEKFFTSDQVGKKLWMKAFYLNARGEAGPEGEVFSVVII